MKLTASFSAAELAHATGGDWLNTPPTAEARFTLDSDSRTVSNGTAFVALSGERFDGHDFLAAVAQAGAQALIIAREKCAKLPTDNVLPVLAVPDTLAAFQALAAFHRRRFPALRLVAITGSVGKTSVKEMLRAICTAASDADAVLYTEGNTNNQIGVAQNLLRLTDRHRYAVIEMGTNHHGEIAPLAAMAAPSVALVNTIAPCHLEFLGDLDGVAREKGHILSALPATGTAVFPMACAGVHELEKAAAHRPWRRFGAAGADVMSAEYQGGSLEGSTVELHFPGGARRRVEWRLSGAHQADNAAAAAAAALALGIGRDAIVCGLSATRLPGMRMQITEHEGVRWINDAYNANPSSMAAALKNLAQTTDATQLIVVLGDMLELGSIEADEHRKLLTLAATLFPTAARLVAIGPRLTAARDVLTPEAAAKFDFHLDSATAKSGLAQWLTPGISVFLKASNSMNLKALLPQ